MKRSPQEGKSMLMNVRKGIIFSTGLLALVVLLVAATAQANARRVTRGDAQAISEAFGNGGWAVVLNGGTLNGAPADFLPDSKARISPATPWHGRHFCSLDWHVINLAAIEGNAAGESRTNVEIRELLSHTDLVLTLDGSPLDTMRTAIKPLLNPERVGLVEAYYVQEAQVLAPQDLSVGQHSLEAPQVSPPITFFIDAPGEGTCL